MCSMEYLVGAGPRPSSSLIDTSIEGFKFNTHRMLLMKLTSEKEDDASGYHYEELVALSHNSPYFRQELVEYLIEKMSSRSWTIRHKSVKALSKLCHDGHPDVRGLIRMRDGDLRKTLDECPPHNPINGHTDIAMYTSSVKDLLRFVFTPRNVEPTTAVTEEPKKVMVGIGSSKNTGKYEGFGSSPIQREEGVFDMIIDAVEKVSRGSTGDDPTMQRTLEENNGDWPGLDPEVIGMQEALDSLEEMFQKLKKPTQPTSASPKPAALIPGKAGGGWESDSEDEDSKKEEKESQFRKEAITKYLSDLIVIFPNWPLDVAAFKSYVKKAFDFKQEELAQILVSHLETTEDATVLYIYLFFVDTCVNMSVLSGPTCRKFLYDTLYYTMNNPTVEKRAAAKCHKMLTLIEGLLKMIERKKAQAKRA